jgi:poly-gamma-glutamate synthesis protein (capsule biosynthesis protein)
MSVLWTLAVVLAMTTTKAFAVEGSARVAFVGDVMLAETEGTGKLIAKGGDPFAKVRGMLADADLRVANFESSSGTKGSPDPDKPYSFRTSPSALPGFASVFEAAGLANNHAGDFGRADFVETLAALGKAGSKVFGGGKDLAEAHRAALFERNGVKIALLGYLDFFPRWFAAAPGMPGVAWLDEDQAALDIAKARAEGADVVVIVPHWGVEHEPKANDRQRRISRTLLDAGANAVIGGHPHVVQDYEIYKGKPIVYSLGNFVFDGFEDEDNVTGWALFADFDKQGISSITTRVVRIDANGSPAPEPTKAGPCWKRGEASFSPCKGTQLE